MALPCMPGITSVQPVAGNAARRSELMIKGVHIVTFTVPVPSGARGIGTT